MYIGVRAGREGGTLGRNAKWNSTAVSIATGLLILAWCMGHNNARILVIYLHEYISTAIFLSVTFIYMYQYVLRYINRHLCTLIYIFVFPFISLINNYISRKTSIKCSQIGLYVRIIHLQTIGVKPNILILLMTNKQKA